MRSVERDQISSRHSQLRRRGKLCGGRRALTSMVRVLLFCTMIISVMTETSVPALAASDVALPIQSDLSLSRLRPKPLATPALEKLASRVGWLRDLKPKPETLITGEDFAGLCALLTGTSSETLMSMVGEGPIARQQATAVVAASFHGRRLRFADFTDRESIAPALLESVEKLYAYGFFKDGGAFYPNDSLTWDSAAKWLNCLAEQKPAPAPAAVSFLGFSAGAGKLTEGQQAALRDYFDLHHSAMAALSSVNMTSVFVPGQSREVELDNTVLSCLIDTRRHSPLDLTMTAYSYQLNVVEVTGQNDGTVKIYLGEYGAMFFRGMNGKKSEEPLVHHTFVLAPAGDSWRVLSHSRDDTGFLRFEDATDRLAEERTYLAEVRNNLLARQGQRDLTCVAPVACSHPLNRHAAVAYAQVHADIRNPVYADYTGLGGNCQNFVSQCLAAGGAPQDNVGEKWNTGSLSWINVRRFKEYAQRNIGTGLAVRVNAPYYCGKPGDVLHMGFVNDGKHAMLITGVITDESGAVVDYTVCSNTCNWRNMPMSAHWYTDQTLIKVYGWND